MRLSKIIFVLVFASALVGTAWSQSPATGTIVTNFTITVSSAISSITPITCQVNADVSDCNPTTGQCTSFGEQAAAIAQRTSAGSATCSVTIPYSWDLPNRSTDQVQLNYLLEAKLPGNLSAAGLGSVTVTKLTVNNISTLFNASTATSHPVHRKSSQSDPAVNIPADGTTTTETAKFTI